MSTCLGAYEHGRPLAFGNGVPATRLEFETLVADGQRYEWSKLRLAKKQPKRRIMLLRKGWGIFGPLPLGGNYHDLEQAKHAISRFYQIDDESE